MSAPATSTARLIPITLIDEPAIAMRETMNEGAMRELVDSIRAEGLLQRIGLVESNGRYQIIYGHRRYLAARSAGLVDVPSEVHSVDRRQVERMKCAENLRREDVNPAEEATYFASLLAEFCHDDTNELAEFTGLRREYVERRLVLLRGHRDVFAAVAAGEISLGVAEVLNRFPDDEGIKMHLQSARGGATQAIVKRWLTAYQNFRALNPGEPAPATPTDQAPAPIVMPAAPACQCCARQVDNNRLVAWYVHDYCVDAILKPLLEAYRGAPAGADR